MRVNSPHTLARAALMRADDPRSWAEHTRRTPPAERTRMMLRLTADGREADDRVRGEL